MAGKILVVYYSWAKGNTKRIAELAQKATGADLAVIDTVSPYTGSYNDVVQQGQNEVNRGYQPEIKPLSVNVADYDTILIGTPTWWYTMAPAMLTFLTANDWHGKKVVPFMTNGGWPGHVIADMKKVCNGAEFACEKEIRFDSEGGDRLVTPEAELNAWLNALKLL